MNFEFIDLSESNNKNEFVTLQSRSSTRRSFSFNFQVVNKINWVDITSPKIFKTNVKSTTDISCVKQITRSQTFRLKEFLLKFKLCFS